MKYSSLLALPLLACGSDMATKAFNANPEITITSHSESISIDEGSTVNFRGQVSDSNHSFDLLEVSWYNGEDLVCDWEVPGDAGETSCNITLGSDDTFIVAEVRDAQGAAGRDEVTVLISPTSPPGGVIISPYADGSYRVGQVIEFKAFVSDEEDDPSDLAIKWESSLDGMLNLQTPADSAGNVLGSGLLTEGQHLIQLHVTDTSGKSISEGVTIEVGPPGPSFISPALITPATGVFVETTLTCSATAVDPDGVQMVVAYTWNNLTTGAALGGTNSLTLDTSIAHVNDVIQCAATVTDNEGQSASTTDTVTVENRMPVITNLVLDPQTVYTNDTLTATASATDADGETVTLNYEWQVNGTVVQSGTGNTLDGTQYFDRGDSISLSVTASDSSGTTTPVTENRVCANSLPTAPVITVSPASPEAGIDDIVCEITSPSTDDDGDAVSYTFSWLVDGAGYGNASNTANSSTVPTSDLSPSETWTCIVSTFDGTDYGASATETVQVQTDWDGERVFTNCGQTGNTGPSQSQCDGSYSGTYLEGEVSVTSGIQYWVVPATGTYRIEVYGAAGGGSAPGNGAMMVGELSLNSGDTLKILVGQMGTDESYSRSYLTGAGGGGSFVTDSADTPLIVAGGGGGCGADSPGQDAVTSETGNTGSSGDGGICSVSVCEGNFGAGFYGNGGIGAHLSGSEAQSFVNGGTGGVGASSGGAAYGGFGGGGGEGYADGGGAGGYSGGNSFADGTGGAGGGSYNSGSNQSNSIGNASHGMVIIDRL